jgi:hypothetical protein
MRGRDDYRASEISNCQPPDPFGSQAISLEEIAAALIILSGTYALSLAATPMKKAPQEATTSPTVTR